MPNNNVINWGMIIYPESMPSNYISIIDSWHVEAALSPLHDPSKNLVGTDDDQLKPHYHLYLHFPGKKSYEQVLDMSTQLGTKAIDRVISLRGSVRYLIHRDHPQKQQFAEGMSCITTFAGFQIDEYFKDQGQSVHFCEDLEKIIKETRIDNLIMLQEFLESDLMYYDLLNYVRFNNCFYISKLLDGMFQLNNKKMPLKLQRQYYEDLKDLDS